MLIYPGSGACHTHHLMICQCYPQVLCGNFSFTAGPMVNKSMKSSILKPHLIPTRPILWSQDEQECNIKLGSWTQDGDVVNLTLFNNKVLMLMI